MTTILYELLFRLAQWHQSHVERLVFWLYLRLTDEFGQVEAEQETEHLAPRENTVHIPRRGLH